MSKSEGSGKLVVTQLPKAETRQWPSIEKSADSISSHVNLQSSLSDYTISPDVLELHGSGWLRQSRTSHYALQAYSNIRSIADHAKSVQACIMPHAETLGEASCRVRRYSTSTSLSLSSLSLTRLHRAVVLLAGGGTDSIG